MQIGVYAFCTGDWRQMDYPLDLWLTWHLRIMDSVALATYGDVHLPAGDHAKLKVVNIYLNPMHDTDWNFYTEGKTEAQKLLDTEWKILLDIDEFMYRPAVGTLHPGYAYGLRYHNFYGSIEHEIAGGAIPSVQYRVHHGNRAILGDGANVAQPFDTARSFDVWHTNMCRNPSALAVKWKAQIEREIVTGYNLNAGRLPLLGSAFDYGLYAKAFPGASLHRTNIYTVPDILLENRSRFEWWRK